MSDDAPIRRLVVATGNKGKVREFAEALSAHGVEALGLDALDRAVDEPDETGETFDANARIKAEAYSAHTDLTVVADDSGLEVDALDGAPGVLSARYGGPGLDDEGRNRKLLAAIDEVPDEKRTARFRCALAVARQGKILATFDGTVEGRLLREARGTNGFGYDPLFFHPPSGCTTAELSPEAKRKVSHRGHAIAQLLRWLES